MAAVILALGGPGAARADESSATSFRTVDVPDSVDYYAPGWFGGMAVDPLDGRVYVAAGDVLEVYGPDGRDLGPAASVPHACGLAMTATDLFVMSCATNTIVRLSRPLLIATGSWVMPRPVCCGLAVDGTTVWFAAHDRNPIVLSWVVGRLDTMTGQVQLDVFNHLQHPVLRTHPTRPGELYLSDEGTSPAPIFRWDVTGSTPRLLARSDHTEAGSDMQDFQFDPLGRTIVAAPATGPFNEGPYGLLELDADAVARSGVIYHADIWPSAVAFTTDTLWLVTAVHGGPITAYLNLTHEAKRSFSRDDYPFDALANGLAVSPTGYRIYAVEGFGDLHLNVLEAGLGPPLPHDITTSDPPDPLPPLPVDPVPSTPVIVVPTEAPVPVVGGAPSSSPVAVARTPSTSGATPARMPASADGPPTATGRSNDPPPRALAAEPAPPGVEPAATERQDPPQPASGSPVQVVATPDGHGPVDGPAGVAGLAIAAVASGTAVTIRSRRFRPPLEPTNLRP